MESQNVEYKQSRKDDYLKWICGFANAQGGTLYIGIDGDSNVVSLSQVHLTERQKKLNEFQETMVNVSGPCHWNQSFVPGEGGPTSWKDAEEVYFYHSDHLGSASWITDHHGDAIQHLQYLPFGAPFVDQRASGYHERFTFTGKEKDEETGYGYFGARYMDHELMTGWLSVDPLTGKYPSISPYAYCAWNPVKLVDPDGRECLDNIDWYKTGSGDIVWDDNVRCPSDVKDKNGEYIGNDQALLRRFGFRQKYSQESSSKYGVIYVNSTSYSSAYHSMKAKARMSVNISINSSNIGNNRKIFLGFNVKVQTDSRTTGSVSPVIYSDMVSVSYGNRKLFEQPQQSYNAAYRDGSGRNYSVWHDYFIPAKILSGNKALEVRGKGCWINEDGGCFVYHAAFPYPHYANFSMSNK